MKTLIKKLLKPLQERGRFPTVEDVDRYFEEALIEAYKAGLMHEIAEHTENYKDAREEKIANNIMREKRKQADLLEKSKKPLSIKL